MSDIVNTDSDNRFAGEDVADQRQGGAAGEEGGKSEREGLPRSYRMRADKHYVEQLSSRSAAQPVRIIPLDQFAPCDAPRETDLGPLLQSVRTLGVVHPLLVRRSGSAYAVVAGRKRFAAAQILRLPALPCLVQDLDDAEAAAVARADNLTVASENERVDLSAVDGAVRRAIAEHLTTVRLCANLLAGDGPMKRSALDLSAAHTWRASRLLDALELIANRPPLPTRDRPLAAIVDEVVAGFATEARLGGFSIPRGVRQRRVLFVAQRPRRDRWPFRRAACDYTARRIAARRDDRRVDFDRGGRGDGVSGGPRPRARDRRPRTPIFRRFVGRPARRVERGGRRAGNESVRRAPPRQHKL